MKTRIRIFIVFTGLIGIITISLIGCQDQFLNKQPTETFTGSDIWNDIDLVKKYVNNNYNALGGFRINSSKKGRDEGNALPDALTDNVYLQFNYYNIWDYNRGLLTSDHMTILRYKWETAYKFIKNINRFFQHIDDVDASEDVKSNLKGQMHFLRAWEYARLLNWFGGVPIITKTFSLNDDYNVKRDSYKDGVQWVVSQLDKAVDEVPQTVPSDEWGRITKGAVLALKSRVLLYAASKLHDTSSDPNGPLYTYDVSNKWKDAADAAKAVMDLGEYSLPPVQNPRDYQKLLLHKNSGMILAKQFSPQYNEYGTSFAQINNPNGYGGWSGNNITQNLVDAFQMKDGKSINKSPLYNPAANSIYKNRELRFYADIVYNGTEYRGRNVQFYVPGGKDSPDGPQGWNAQKTGYTIRKHMDESNNFKDTRPTQPRIYFRIAGIYLNYAEAEYHRGNENIARKYVNKIRKRVQLPDIHSSGKELLKDIQHERRIELVFEGYHRIDDLRRWMLADKYLNKNARGISWKKLNQQDELSKNGELIYSVIDVQQRAFKHRMYYVPIPKDEILKSDLKQNVGYK